jgi:hypothetical protein
MPQTWRGTYEGNPEYLGQLRNSGRPAASSRTSTKSCAGTSAPSSPTRASITPPRYAPATRPPRHRLGPRPHREPTTLPPHHRPNRTRTSTRIRRGPRGFRRRVGSCPPRGRAGTSQVATPGPGAARSPAGPRCARRAPRSDATLRSDANSRAHQQQRHATTVTVHPSANAAVPTKIAIAVVAPPPQCRLTHPAAECRLCRLSRPSSQFPPLISLFRIYCGHSTP